MSYSTSLVVVLQGHQWVKIPWKKLQVGNIDRVKKDEHLQTFYSSQVLI
ncbi:unnamed protein product [Rhodiola kirilowii]